MVDIPPKKLETYRVRLMVDGDTLNYLRDASSVTASLATVKLLLSSTLSTPNAVFLTTDIKVFFYGTSLPDPEFMKLSFSILPEEIINQYKLADLQCNG